MIVTEQEINEMRNFVSDLNSMKQSLVIVEGKRDSAALKKIGFSGKVLEYHKFGGIIKFTDSVAKYKNLILLFDGDKKGKHFTRKTIQLLQRRTNIDLTFKRKLTSITKGKIRFIEQLVCYESVFLRPDSSFVKGV
ncbi:MAG: toprim domain-containing protein [Nitrosopumilus sp.]|nr:toprim domain-containing protein [Nitrosopumilus sp.]MDH3386055.1 toprim domain-containing protein [Nitrosopumilus sp.]